MFNDLIESTPFTGPGADAVFTNIRGEDINNDWSFLATLRALAAPRLKAEDELWMSYYSLRNCSNFEGNMRDTCDGAENKLVILSYEGLSADRVDAIVSTIKRMEPDGWCYIDRPTEFYRRFLPVVCAVNPERKVSLVVTGELKNSLLHFLQVGIVVFLPWIFSPEQGLTEEERNLIGSLREKKSEAYKQCLNAMAARYDFRTGIIRSKLAGFESRADERRLATTEGEINDTRERLDDLQEKFNRYMRTLDELNVTRLGLVAKIAENKDRGGEMMEYFLNNRSLVLEAAGSNNIRFGVLGYLTYFDPDLAQGMINNDNSFLYTTPRREGLSQTDLKRFYEAVFIKRSIRIRYCAKYEIKLDGGFEGESRQQYGYEYDGYMPNPHIEYHRCLGNYRSTLAELMRHNEYIGAIEQCIASSRSLNLNDISADEGIRDLFQQNARACVEMADGRVVTAREAAKILKEAEEG